MFWGITPTFTIHFWGIQRLEGAVSFGTLGLETICDFQFKRTENHYKLPIRASMWNSFTP